MVLAIRCCLLIGLDGLSDSLLFIDRYRSFVK
jgi:hypothetical protein